MADGNKRIFERCCNGTEYSRNTSKKRAYKIQPAGERLFRESLCGLHSCLPVLLRFVHEAVYRPPGTLGYISGRQDLAGDTPPGAVCREGAVHRLSDRSLSAPGRSVRAHPRAAGAACRQRGQDQYCYKKRPCTAGSGFNQNISGRPCFLVNQHAGRGVQKRYGQCRQHRAAAGRHESVS